MLAIIGGTGLSKIACFEAAGQETVSTPYSGDAVVVSRFRHEGRAVLFVPRHGADHVLAPHRINYRANIWALKHLGVKEIVAINAVGGIHQDLKPGSLAVPDQLIDYSCGRESTFFADNLTEVTHIDFTHPYDEKLRQRILSSIAVVNASSSVSRAVLAGGVYGCTQGPRLETAAEIVRLRRDGCDMVGMTGMPEAALAREVELSYASIALSVNWAAGLSDKPISLQQIYAVLEDGMEFIAALLQEISKQSD